MGADVGGDDAVESESDSDSVEGEEVEEVDEEDEEDEADEGVAVLCRLTGRSSTRSKFEAYM